MNKKTINICGYDIEVAVNAAFLLIYKQEFNRDGFQDMLALVSAIDGKDPMAGLASNPNVDITFIYRFLWIFAKAANDNVPALDEFIAQFEVAPFDFIMEALNVVIDLLSSNLKTSVKPKKK